MCGKWYNEPDVSGRLWKNACYPLRPATLWWQLSAIGKISAGTLFLNENLILQMR
jgi:hypothetical protein